MRIHVGCELSFDFPQTMPMIVTLNVHFSRFSDLERPHELLIGVISVELGTEIHGMDSWIISFNKRKSVRAMPLRPSTAMGLLMRRERVGSLQKKAAALASWGVKKTSRRGGAKFRGEV
jgi:hypothetical protein